MTPRSTPLFAATALAAVSSRSAAAQASLEDAFAVLMEYDTGSARGPLMTIDDAVVKSLKDQGDREQLEQRLLKVLNSKASTVAKEYVCRKLTLISSAASVAALATLLGDPALAEPARAVLQANPSSAAHAAVRDRLPELSGKARVGALNSLAAWRDASDVSLVAPMLRNGDPEIAAAAAAVLGAIGTVQAAESLGAAAPGANDSVRASILDARLACAERLLASGQKDGALSIYKALSQPEHPKPVQLAAKRGLLTALQQQ